MNRPARKSSVSVAMADNPADLPSLDELLGAIRTPISQPRDDPGANPIAEPATSPPHPDFPPPPTPDTPTPPDENPGDVHNPNPKPYTPTPPEHHPFHIDPAEPPESAPLPPAAQTPHEGMQYECRITILQAWRYDGTMHGKPPWIDPNWIGWSEYDPVRKIPSGPCLRVPTARADSVICRPGDYVVRQNVRVADGANADYDEIEVWSSDTFQRFFIPITGRRQM